MDWQLIISRPRQNGCHFPNDICKCIFLHFVTISLKFVPNGTMNNIPALVQIMLGADQATRHYLNQWWFVYWRIFVSLSLNELFSFQSYRLPAVRLLCNVLRDLCTPVQKYPYILVLFRRIPFALSVCNFPWWYISWFKVHSNEFFKIIKAFNIFDVLCNGY